MVIKSENHGNRVLLAAMNAKLLGSGDETVVLAHGYGGDQSMWDKVVPPLAQRSRVLVFDWSFSGSVKDPTLFDAAKYGSYDAFAEDLIALLEEMGLRSTIFVGHSMSGMIGCIASIKRPDLFKRLILVVASPRYINSEDYEGGFENSDVEQIFSNIESDYSKWAKDFASSVTDSNDPRSAEKFESCLKRMGPEVALPLAKVVFLSDERDLLPKVLTPCTIIQTRNDVAVPNSVANFMLNKIKGKTTVEIINTDGHFPHITAHLEFLDVLGRVLGF